MKSSKDEIRHGQRLQPRQLNLEIGDLIGIDGTFDDGRGVRLEPAQLPCRAGEGRALRGEKRNALLPAAAALASMVNRSMSSDR